MPSSGDVVDLDLGSPVGREAGFAHPAVVVTAQRLLDSEPVLVQVVPLTATIRPFRSEVRSFSICPIEERRRPDRLGRRHPLRLWRRDRGSTRRTARSGRRPFTVGRRPRRFRRRLEAQDPIWIGETMSRSSVGGSRDVDHVWSYNVRTHSLRRCEEPAGLDWVGQGDDWMLFRRGEPAANAFELYRL